MNYKILNSIDEQGRVMGVPKFYQCTSSCQHDTHRLSYDGTRALVIAMGTGNGI